MALNCKVLSVDLLKYPDVESVISDFLGTISPSTQPAIAMTEVGAQVRVVILYTTA